MQGEQLGPGNAGSRIISSINPLAKITLIFGIPVLLHPPLEYPTTSIQGGSKKKRAFLSCYKIIKMWVTCTTQILWYIYQRDRYHLLSAQQRCHQEFHQLDFHQLCLLEWSLKGMWKYKGMKLGMKFIIKIVFIENLTWLTLPGSQVMWHLSFNIRHLCPRTGQNHRPESMGKHRSPHCPENE